MMASQASQSLTLLNSLPPWASGPSGTGPDPSPISDLPFASGASWGLLIPPADAPYPCVQPGPLFWAPTGYRPNLNTLQDPPHREQNHTQPIRPEAQRAGPTWLVPPAHAALTQKAAVHISTHFF